MGWFQDNQPRWVNDLLRDHRQILKAVQGVQRTSDNILASVNVLTLQKARFNYVVGPVTTKQDRAVGFGMTVDPPTMKGR